MIEQPLAPRVGQPPPLLRGEIGPDGRGLGLGEPQLAGRVLDGQEPVGPRAGPFGAAMEDRQAGRVDHLEGVTHEAAVAQRAGVQWEDMQDAVGDEDQSPDACQPLDHRPDDLPAEGFKDRRHPGGPGLAIEAAVDPAGLVVTLIPLPDRLECLADIQLGERDVLDAGLGDDQRQAAPGGEGILDDGRRHVTGKQTPCCLGVDGDDRSVGMEFRVMNADAPQHVRGTSLDPVHVRLERLQVRASSVLTGHFHPAVAVLSRGRRVSPPPRRSTSC